MGQLDTLCEKNTKEEANVCIYSDGEGDVPLSDFNTPFTVLYKHRNDIKICH